MSTPSQRKKARHLLVQALYQWHMSGSSLVDIEAEFCTDHDMKKLDGDYFREILHGVAKQVDAIEATYTPHLDRAENELDPIARAVLQLSCYEMLYRIDVPYKVVINEAVSLAKKFGATDSYKYINGVMDKVAADKRAAEVQATRG
ncbi:MAG: transcription antitermination factor NusB [Porticoccaceae bacterium]|nr:transcription antitermination factor NusB [Porticoccaceae bacterium]